MAQDKQCKQLISKKSNQCVHLYGKPPFRNEGAGKSPFFGLVSLIIVRYTQDYTLYEPVYTQCETGHWADAWSDRAAIWGLMVL